MDFREFLEQHSTQYRLIDIRRDSMNVDDIRGFVKVVTENLVIIQVVNDSFAFNGISVINLQDVSFLRWGTKIMSFWETQITDSAPELSGLLPRHPDNWESLIGMLNGKGMFSIFRENDDTSTCYVSDDLSIHGAIVTGSQISQEGSRRGNFAMNIADITRVDFKGTYEISLEKMQDK